MTADLAIEAGFDRLAKQTCGQLDENDELARWRVPRRWLMCQEDNYQMEQEACMEVERIASGIHCLATGGEHLWRSYTGQRGRGVACERCFMTQDALGKITWQITKYHANGAELPPSPPSDAVGVLKAWHCELARLEAGGCISGAPSHSWVDTRTHGLLRLACDSRYCELCGVVESVNDKKICCPPNLIGQFGLPVASTYRGE